MVSIENRAKALAMAIKQSGGGRIKEDAAKAVQLAYGQAAMAGQCDILEAVEIAGLFTNISALNQDLERYGVIKVTRDIPALYSHVASALAALSALPVLGADGKPAAPTAAPAAAVVQPPAKGK